MIDLMVLLIAVITGFFVKLTDLIDEHRLKFFRGADILFGFIYGVLIGYVISNSEVVAPLWLGTLAGCIFFGKIDGYGHYAGIGTAIVYILVFGMPEISWTLAAVFAAASICDEALIWLKRKKRLKGLAAEAINLRPLVEMTALVASAVTGLWMMWLAILCFDIAYNMAGIIKR